jgi:hypothetical protein
MGAIPEPLLAATREHRMVPFIGAGFSKQVSAGNYPNWVEFLHTLLSEARRIGVVDRNTASHIKHLIKSGQYLMAAESIRKRLPSDAYASLIETSFDPPQAKPARVHSLLLALNPRLVITTNYDKLIENAYAATHSQSMTVVTQEDPAKVQRRLQDDKERERPFLFKLHGDVEDISTIVLTESDYRRSIHDNTGNQMVLSSIFLTHVVLFIGFSFSDPELLLTVSRMRHALKSHSTPDYALMSDANSNPVQAERFRADFGIETIYYKYDARHSGVGKFLRALCKKAFP